MSGASSLYREWAGARSLVILIPVLNRPHRVRRTIADVAKATPEPYRLLFVAQDDDIAELAELEAAGADFLVVTPKDSTYARKINVGARSTTEDLIFTAADDLHFHHGWLTTALGKLKREVGVLGTNDLGNRGTIDGRHSTHSLVTRDYLEEQGGTWDKGPGVVLNDEYRHWCCDNELVEVAMARKAWAHAPDCVVEHLHPVWGKGRDDGTYALGRAMQTVDTRTFLERRKQWVHLL